MWSVAKLSACLVLGLGMLLPGTLPADEDPDLEKDLQAHFMKVIPELVRYRGLTNYGESMKSSQPSP